MAEDRMLSDEVLLALIKKNSGGGGGGGTDDYNDLKNQPQINNNTLIGNKTASDLGLVAAETGKGLSSNDYTNEDKAIVGGVTAALAGKVDKVEGKGLSTNDFTDAYKTAIGANTTAISGIKDGTDIDSFADVETALADKADKSAVKSEFIGTTAEWNALTTAQKKAYDTYQITNDYTEGSGGLPDYSTTEQLTGQKWIDGKDIYFKVLDLSSNPITLQHDGWVSTTVAATGINAIIDGNVIALTNSDERLVLKHYEIGIINGYVAVCLATSVGARRMSYVTIYYTKTA